jgi:hypothetical protein
MLFVDLNKAFNMVDQCKLISIIKAKGILDDAEIHLLCWILKNSYVRFGSQVVACTNGVPQGSTLSPYLFAIYA